MTDQHTSTQCNAGIAVESKPGGRMIHRQPDIFSTQAAPTAALYAIDSEDLTRLHNKPPSYVRGWNQVKRS